MPDTNLDSAKDELHKTVQEFGWISSWGSVCREQEAILVTYESLDFPWEIVLWDGTFGRTALALPGSPDPFIDNPRWIVGEGRHTPHPLIYDPTLGRAIFTEPYPAPPSHVRKIVKAYSAVARLASFNPRQYELEIELLSDRAQKNWAETIIREEFKKATILHTSSEEEDVWVSKLERVPKDMESPHPGSVNTIPPIWMTGMYGWYDPTVENPHLFATPYLSPIFGDSNGGDYPYTERWGLFLNGLSEPLLSAAWNDTPALSKLVQEVTDGELDSKLVHYGLLHELHEIAYHQYRHDISRGNV